MKNATMLYKKGTQIKTELGMFDTIVVDKCDEEKFDAALADGWYESQQEVIDGKVKQPEAPKLAEQESKPEPGKDAETTEPGESTDSKAQKAIKIAQEKLKDK